MSKTAAQAELRVAAGLALIFDLDGVIVDSMPVHELAWRRYLETLGFDGGDIPSRMHGRRNDEIVRDFLGETHLGKPIDDDTVVAHGAAKERVFREMLGDRLRETLVAGITEWLDHVEGAPIALATNAERENIDFTLDGAGLRRYFDVIVDCSEVSRPKPAPDVYLRAAELLKIAPGNCIVFEDSPVGVAAALAAGMRVVGVRTHSSPLEGVVFSVANFLDPQLDGWLSAQRTV
jgi:beta-phosphoglucomutase family hydrolase